MPWAADSMSLNVWLALQVCGSEAGEAGGARSPAVQGPPSQGPPRHSQLMRACTPPPCLSPKPCAPDTAAAFGGTTQPSCRAQPDQVLAPGVRCSLSSSTRACCNMPEDRSCQQTQHWIWLVQAAASGAAHGVWQKPGRYTAGNSFSSHAMWSLACCDNAVLPVIQSPANTD